MEKYNNKQISHSVNLVLKNKRKLLTALFVFTAIIFMGPALYTGIIDGEWTPFYSLLGLGATAGYKMSSMALIGDVSQPADTETAPNQIGFRLYLVAFEQIDDTVAFPSPNSNREVGTIPLKAGEYMHYFEGVKDSNKYVSTAEKGDVTSTFNKTFNTIVVSNNKTLDFIEQYQGKGFLVIFQECETGTKYIIGNYCKPAYLTNFENKEDSDGKYITLTFSNDHWRQQNIYIGSITTAAPITVVQDATSITIASGNDNYVLSDPSAANVAITAFSGVAAADVGRVITVNAPAVNTYDNTIADNASYILKDGVTWTAKPGSSITFEIFDETTFVEISRVQTA